MSEPTTVTKTAPELIWLQHSDDMLDVDLPFPDEHDGISWCHEQVFMGDVEYIRKDLYAALKRQRDALLEAAKAALHYMRLHKYADQAWADDLEAAIDAAMTPNARLEPPGQHGTNREGRDVTNEQNHNSAAEGRSDLEGVVMRDEALKWRVRFKTPDGMYTFTDISKRGGFKLDRSEVEDWAETQVRAQPDKYASVAAVLNLDADGA